MNTTDYFEKKYGNDELVDTMGIDMYKRMMEKKEIKKSFIF